MGRLARADWLNAGRLRAWLLVFVCLEAVAAVYIAWVLAHAGGDGKPIATDFASFWSAARVAVSGHPADAYDTAIRVAVQHANTSFGGNPNAVYGFFYPPLYLLLILPLGLLGYVPAMLVFLAGEYALAVAGLTRIAGNGQARLALAAAPALLMNMIIGQNGPLSAACFAGGAIWLETRPVLAGLCLSLLICKPHLALVLPLGLAASGRWRVFFACGFGVVFFSGVATLALGSQSWVALAQNYVLMRDMLQNFADDLGKIQSVYEAVRLWGGSVGLAYAVHGVVALGVLTVLVRLLRRRPGGAAEMAAMVTAGLLVTPYVFDYDLACLLVPMAWLLAQISRTGWRDWEKYGLAAAYMLPLFARTSTTTLGIPLVPPVLGIMLALIAARILRAPPRGGVFA